MRDGVAADERRRSWAGAVRRRRARRRRAHARVGPEAQVIVRAEQTESSMMNVIRVVVGFSGGARCGAFRERRPRRCRLARERV